MTAIYLILFFNFFFAVCAIDNLRVAYEWKELDFEFPTPRARRQAIERGEFIPENNLPTGLEVYRDRLFITVPRWKAGVPASLTYINLTDAVDAPKLRPYPNWEAHRIRGNSHPEIVSPMKIRADKCGRLWVLDTGISNITSTETAPSTRLLIYNLHSDTLLRQYNLPRDQVGNMSFFANIAVEDHDCGDAFAYLGDAEQAAIVVYSWASNKSWKRTHHFFHIDPLSGVFSTSQFNYFLEDGIFGMALSKPDPEGYSTLYFHPLTSVNEFSVNTKFLRDPNTNNTHFHEFKVLGSRGDNAQSGASFLHQKSDVLFYSLINLNAVACWRTTNPEYNMPSQGRIFMSDSLMIFPSDVKVDADDNLWVLSNKFPNFIYNHNVDYTQVNFRILTGKVADAIVGTTCDSKLVIPSPNKPNATKDVKGRSKSGVSSLTEDNFTLITLLVTVFINFFCR